MAEMQCVSVVLPSHCGWLALGLYPQLHGCGGDG